MSTENRDGQFSGKTFVSRSETAFNTMQEYLKANPKLDFVEGFHEFPETSLASGSHVEVERLLMFVAPRIPILDSKKMYVFLRDLAGDYEKVSGEKHINNLTAMERLVRGATLRVAVLSGRELLDTVRTTTTYGQGSVGALPNVNTSSSESRVNIFKKIEIVVFPDRVSATEAVEKYKSKDESFFYMLTPEQIRRLKARNKQGLINHLLHRSGSGKK